MKFTDTLYYFLPVMMGAAGLVLILMFGSADGEVGASQKKVIAPSAECMVYLPAQYTLNAPNVTSENVQAL